VTISWTAVDTPVAGYYVYRSSGSGRAVNLTSRAFYGTQFMDTAVEPGQTYSYYVTSVNYKGIESRPSETVSVTVPANVTPPAKN
jgi:fibronectin type 3 domain-containing protein